MKFDLEELKTSAHYVDPRYYIGLFSHNEDEDTYVAYKKEDLILRDQLAIDRTILANESTLLSYIRTGLAIVATGATIVHFVEKEGSNIFGIAFILFGLAMLFVGANRYKKMKHTISAIRENRFNLNKNNEKKSI